MIRPLSLILLAACASCDSAGPPPTDINKVFVEADDATIKKFVGLFEGEAREISVAREEITAALGLSAGMTIGDIGAGTGLFEPIFNETVGLEGKVYAVDLAPKMVEHLNKRIKEENLSTVEAIQCTSTNTNLPANSCDLIFVCDTYHHFEHPQQTLADIKRALKPNGRLVIVDFYRIEGESRDWVMSHVRCGLETVIEETTLSGFTFLKNHDIDGLKENYLIIFEK
jgi:SAM-dependent methyltransferase